MLTAGGKFGDFDVVRELGQGGMGAVYLVRDPETGDEYAAKIMLEYARLGEDAKRRFIREAEIAMKVEHPNLVRVYDVGRDPETGYAYMIMDYLGGGDLRDALARRLVERQGPFSAKGALAVVRPILCALAAAAHAGVVHRDIKPDNILFDEDGTPYLSDLGIAKISDDETLTRLTMSNVIVGTPAYMAPEQILDSHRVDIRADIYSLGVVLWEMLAGECPNAEMTPSELMARAVKGQRLKDIRTIRPKLPAYVVRFLRRMTDPNPHHRFETPEAAIGYLDEWRKREAHWLRVWITVVATSTALIIALVLFFGIRAIRNDRLVPVASETKPIDPEFAIPDSVE